MKRVDKKEKKGKNEVEKEELKKEKEMIKDVKDSKIKIYIPQEDK